MRELLRCKSEKSVLSFFADLREDRMGNKLDLVFLSMATMRKNSFD